MMRWKIKQSINKTKQSIKTNKIEHIRFIRIQVYIRTFQALKIDM